jgi:hypothetical protein
MSVVVSKVKLAGAQDVSSLFYVSQICLALNKKNPAAVQPSTPAAGNQYITMQIDP